MKRDYKLFLNDIRESIQQIEEYLKGVSEQEFMSNKLKQDAVVRRLEIIGEATKNIPRSLKVKNKHVPWFDIGSIQRSYGSCLLRSELKESLGSSHFQR